jgi:polysaccharide biosynthesis protein PslH
VKKKILVVSSDFPYPANHGGRVDIWERIKMLKELNYEVYLISTINSEPNEEDIKEVKKYVKEISLSRRNVNLNNLFSIIPFQMKSREGLKYINDISGTFDYILLEGEYVFPVLKNKNIEGKKIILRVHNDELIYLKSLFNSTKRILKKVYYFTEYSKFKIVKTNITKYIDNYLFISNDEHNNFKLTNSRANTIFLPPEVNENELKSRTLDSSKVLFIGSLFMENNKEAIKWYIEKVHSKVSNLDYELLIAGNSRGEDISWLTALIEKYKNIKIYDSPSDLEFLYEQCSIFINPMQNGAGVKLKTIEAIKNGLPVVSTSVGIEGTGLIDPETVYITDYPEEYARKIDDLLQNDDLRVKLVRNSQDFLKKNYNSKERLYNFLNEIK